MKYIFVIKYFLLIRLKAVRSVGRSLFVEEMTDLTAAPHLVDGLYWAVKHGQQPVLPQ